MHTTKIKDIKLSEELSPESRFPDYLIKISDTYYSVYHKDKHIGEVYLYNGIWKAFTICVDQVDDTLDGCIRFLIRNY